MASPTSGIKRSERLARRTGERPVTTAADSARGPRAPVEAWRVAAAAGPLAARRADLEPTEHAVSSRAASRGKTSAMEAAAARRAQLLAQLLEGELSSAPDVESAGDSLSQAARASGAAGGAGPESTRAADSGSAAVSASMRGLRASSAFGGTRLSATEAGATVAALSGAIRDAPGVALDVATAGLRLNQSFRRSG